MKLNANDIPIFAAVAEHRGITAAANVLGIPKSTVSNAINRLEKELGLRLLERNSRNIRLTSEGETFYKHSAVISEHLEEAIASVSSLQNEPKGKLSIALTIAFSREVIGSKLLEFKQRYPLIELDVRVSNDYKIDVISDPVDVAIKIGELSDSELIVTKLLQTPLLWVASPAYMQQAQIDEDEEDLARHIQIIDKRYTKLPLAMRQGRVKREITIGNVDVSNDPLVVRDWLIAGGGVSLIPEVFCKDQVATGQLKRLNPTWKVEPESVISAVYPSRRLASAKTLLFINFLKEVIRREDPSAP